MIFLSSRVSTALSIAIFFLGSTLQVQAYEGKTQSELEAAFKQAMDYLHSFNNDSAKIILSQLSHELCERKEMHTPFGLNVKLRYAEALEKDEENDVAIEKLLHVGEVSLDLEQWDVLAHSYLSLARLYEKLNRAESCEDVLKKAFSTIQTHKLDSIYPRLSIRYSSYHRFYGKKDSAMFFAREVVQTAPSFGLYEEEAVGNLLIGMLLDPSDYREIVKRYSLAGNYWKNSGDMVGYGSIMKNLSTIYLRKKNFRKALLYNDSALVAYKQAQTKGNDEPYYLYASYKERAEILSSLGRLDSALYYQKLGYEQELADAYLSNKEKVIEIDAKYKDEKKAKQLEEQAQLIAYEREKRNWLILGITVVLGLAGLLTYYALKLNWANITTREQAIAIAKANEDLSLSLQQQIMLQGEVHHRVKNNLQVLISLLELQSQDIEDPKALKNLEAMSHRIYSMAAIHEILYKKQGAEAIKLLDYTQNLCKHFSAFLGQQGKPIFELEMDNHSFNLETLMPLGIILNELLTNSLKYATSMGKQLSIQISLLRDKEGYFITYRDNGPGFPDGSLQEREGGLGTYLLKSMSRQLNGYIDSRNDNGAVYQVYFKTKNSQQSKIFTPQL